MKIVLITIWTLLSFAQAPVFYEVEILGLSQVTKEDLIDVLEPYVGKPFDSSQKEQLTKDLSEITLFESATFKLSVDNALQLFIQERKPYARFEFKQMHYIDLQGNFFEAFGSFAPKELPWVKGPWQTKSSIEKDQKIFVDGIYLIQTIEEILNQQPTILEWNSDQGWTFWLPTFEFGIHVAKKEYRKKLSRLRTIESEIMAQKDKISGIDLDFRDRIIVALKPISDSE